jgi:GT2 family glycosyltransferase
MKISIVIPSFNGRQLLAKNLPRVLTGFPKAEIIIVDDGSIDKTASFIKKTFPKIKLVKKKKNTGFSSSVNLGFKKAKHSLVLLLNNDCYPKKDLLKYLLPYFNKNTFFEKDTFKKPSRNSKTKKTFAVSCLEEVGEKKRGRGIGGFKKGFLHHKAGSLDKNNTLWVFGASTLYNKEIFEKLGGFDESFDPFYWEDFDLSYRALKMGYGLYFEKKAKVVHNHSSTISRFYTTSFIRRVSFRNQILTCWKNLTDLKFLLSHILWFPYHLIITSLKTKGDFLIGFLGAVLKLDSILRFRNKIKFLHSDKEVLAPFQKELG